MGPPPSRKRARSSHDSSSSSGDEQRPTNRARRRSASPARAPQQNNNNDDGGDNTADEFVPPNAFTSLHSAAESAIEQYMNDQLYGLHTHENCFTCEFQKAYENQVRRTGGQVPVLLDGSYCYAMMREYHKENPFEQPGPKARALTRIYEIHGYEPAKRANGGVPPPHFPVPSVRKMLEHLMLYTLDPASINMEALQATRQLVFAFGHKVVVDGMPDSANGRVLLNAIEQMSKLMDKQIKLAGENFNSPFALDPERILAFASTRPLEAIRSQATTDALGGATATNNQASVAMVTAQRPTFGTLPSIVVEEEEDSSGSGSERSRNDDDDDDDNDEGMEED